MLFGGIQQLFSRGGPGDYLWQKKVSFQVVVVLPHSCVGQIMKSVDQFLCGVQECEEGEEFDPLKEMMKLVEMEEREGKQFRDHLKALNVDLKELGLEDQEEWGHDEL